MYSQQCLQQQPPRGSVARQLLPGQQFGGSRRILGPPCKCVCSSYSTDSSSRQQPLRGTSIPPLPVPNRHLQQQQQRRHLRQRHVAGAAVEAWPSLQRRSRSKYVNRLNKEHGVPGFFEFYQSADTGQPVLYIMHARGHTLEVHLQGATITRWLKPDGEDLLHVRSDTPREPGEPINSGIPLAFPQWRDGDLPYNGFADKLEWSVVVTEFDGEFVNTDVSPEQWYRGEAQLAVDEDGYAVGPRPYGLIDDEDIRGEWEADDEAALAERMDELDAAEQAQAEAASTTKKRGGRKKKAELEAEAAAAAAAEQQQGPAEVPSADAADGEEAAAAAAAVTQPLAAAAADDQQVTAAAPELPEQADTSGQPAAAAAGAGDSGGGEGEDEAYEDELEDIEYGIIDDLAPYVILQLKDTPETRAIWPHKFELYYKITLMETDDFPDAKAGLPRGIFDYAGSDTPLGPEDDGLREMLHGDDEALSMAAALEMAERYRASNIRNGIGLDGVYSDAEADSIQPMPGRASYTGMRTYTDLDGPIDDDDDDDDDDGGFGGGAAAGGKGARGRGKGRAKAAVDEGSGAAAAAAAAAGFDDDDEDGEAGIEDLPPGLHAPEEPPMQVKMEWVLINKDPQGSPPMSFQLGALPHFKTEDQSKHGEFVRVLGLGGSMAFDWSHDSRKPRLTSIQEDYVTFDGTRSDCVYVNSSIADVMFCPGSRTHFEVMAREGMPDHVTWHPGALGVPGLEVEPRFFAQLGAGKLALPKKLAPGDQWKGEFVLRYHEAYWDPPIFDRDAPQPLPKLIPQRDDADDREPIDEDHVIEGITSSRLGGGRHVPDNDM